MIPEMTMFFPTGDHMNHFVYVPGLVGVETELDRFHWSFGCCPRSSEREAFENCKIRVHLTVVPDKHITIPAEDPAAAQFRRFTARPDAMELFFAQRFLRCIECRFSLEVKGDDIYAKVGRNYYKKIRYKVMNIHPIWYVLFDLASVLLLRKGYLPVYASAVIKYGEAALIMGPPGIGKTFTALSLSMKHGFGILSEDIAVTDGERIWPVPWTQTYRSYGKDYETHAKTVEKIFDPARVEKIFLLGRGAKREAPAPEPFEKIRLLNRYGVGYSHAPALIALNYFNPGFSLARAETAETGILRKLSEQKRTFFVSSDDPKDYCDAVCGIFLN